METIKINDIEYVKKEELDKLNAGHKITQKDMMITDHCCVMAIVPLKKEQQIAGIEELEITDFGTFKKFTDKIQDLKFEKLDEKFKPEKFILDATKYGLEYLEKAIKTAKAFGYTDKPEFYLKYENNKFVQDFPCLIKIWKMCFLVAPRVESE